MTHQYTKLADALESYTGDGHGYQVDDAVLREAARILRAADAVDVGELMAMSDTSIVLAWDYLMTHKESAKAKAIERRAALESALRLALAAREDYVLQLLVAAGHVTQEKVDQARSIAAAAPKGTYPQEDRSREPPCHACGLGYKCRSANCPNTKPEQSPQPHRKEHHEP